MLSRKTRRLLLILGILVLLTVFVLIAFTPPRACQIWVRNDTDGMLTEVTLTFPNHVSRIGDVNAGSTEIVYVPYAELHRIEYHCKRANGSVVNKTVGMKDDGNLSRYEIITTATDYGTSYEWRWVFKMRVKIETVLIRLGLW